MVNPIFDENELNRLKKPKSETPSTDVILINEERIQGIESSLELIIKDYNTHDMLFERFDEPEGFVLDLTHYGFIDESGDNYICLESPDLKKHILLRVNKNRENYFLIGNFESVRIDKNDLQSRVIVFTGRNKSPLDKKLMNDRNISLEEVFAYRFITELSYLKKSVNDPKNFEPNRSWLSCFDVTKIMEQNYLQPLKDKPDYDYKEHIIPHYSSCSPLYGKDIIEAYKLAVKEVVIMHDELERKEKWQISRPDSLNIRLFTVNRYPILGYTTKIHDFIEEPSTDLE